MLSDPGRTENAKQMRVFYWLFGLALIGHEFPWISMNVVETKQSLFSYINSYGELVPVLNVGPVITGVGHLFFFVAAAVLMLNSNVRVHRAVVVLCSPFLMVAFFVQGYKPANHFFVINVIAAIHLVYWLMTLWYRSDPYTVPDDEPRRFLRQTITAVIFLTYIMAGMYKLNEGFFEPQNSPAAAFVWKPFSPMNRALRMMWGDSMSDQMFFFYGLVGISVTVFMELVVPFGLLIRPLRSAAIGLLMLFHLFILSFTAIDFSLVCFSTYPLIADAGELNRFISEYAKRPTRASVGVAAAYALYCSVINVHDRLDHLRESYFNYYHAEVLFRLMMMFSVAYLVMRLAVMVLNGPARDESARRELQPETVSA